nr:hypothetical protein [Candidatus Babeliales bacterium]
NHMYSMTSNMSHVTIEQKLSEKTLSYTHSLVAKYPDLKGVLFVHGIDQCCINCLDILMLPAGWNTMIEQKDRNIDNIIDLFLQKHYLKKSLKRNLINHLDVVTTSLITLSIMAIAYQVYRIKELANGIDDRIKSNMFFKLAKDLEPAYIPAKQSAQNVFVRCMRAKQSMKDAVVQHIVNYDPVTFQI